MTEEYPEFTDEPLLKLRIHTQLTCLDVEVNGVSVFQHHRTSQVTTEWPLNEWLHWGENTVRMIISRPHTGMTGDAGEELQSWRPGSKCGISLYSTREGSRKVISHWGIFWRFADMVFSDSQLIRHGLHWDQEVFDTEYFDRAGVIRNWPGPEDSEQSMAAAGDSMRMEVTRKFTLPDSWPLCDWRDAVEMEASPGYLHLVTAFYKNVWQVLCGADLRELRRLMEFRTAAYARAYHLRHRHEADDLLAILPAVSSGDWEWNPLNISQSRLFLHSNRKIVELRTADDNKGIIQFKNAEGLSGAIEVALSCISGKWTWIR